jgi:DNA-binding XRE family transcriptional regulator
VVENLYNEARGWGQEARSLVDVRRDLIPAYDERMSQFPARLQGQMKDPAECRVEERLGRDERLAAMVTKSAERHDHSEGVVTGYVLKMVRESLGLSQERLAEELSVDPHTIQGLESGRRPLMATQVRVFVDLCQRLRLLGARPELVEAMDTALSADHLLTYFLEAGDAVGHCDHPLSRWVLTRHVSHMVMWPLTGMLPVVFRGVPPRRRRGPVANGPSLALPERKRVFEHLQAAAELSVEKGDRSVEGQVLLRRQAYYHLGWNTDSSSQEWLEESQRREHRRLPVSFDRWSPDWVAARSLAVALARVGDKEPLQDFIRNGIVTDACIRADLHYWAYWLGETGSVQHSDDFMAEDPDPGLARRVLARLVERLAPDNACVDLYAHSIRTLVETEHDRPPEDSTVCRQLKDRVEQALTGWELSDQSRAELEAVRRYV